MRVIDRDVQLELNVDRRLDRLARLIQGLQKYHTYIWNSVWPKPDPHSIIILV